MRNLSSGNKMNFTVFALIVVIILIILISAVVIVLKTDKEEYAISSTSCIYDSDYNYIDLENDGVISKKWTGNYYLKEDVTKEQYKLGSYAVSYDKLKNSVDLFGNFYQVLNGGDIAKISGYNTVNSSTEDKFYKIDDRKYLIIAKDIKNDTGSLSTQNYLIIIIDKLGNALLLNNEINVKTINQMTISTNDFAFDVANEVLMFNNESINLKKIIGSTNQYVQKTEEEQTEDNTDEENTTEENNTEENTIVVAGNTQNTATTNNNNSTTTTVIQNGNTTNNNSNNSNNNSNNSSNSNSSNKIDTSWVDSLNSWIGDVANAFESIYNGSNNSNTDDSTLNRSIALNSLSSGTTYVDINYTVNDPENKYNVVYANITDGSNSQSISLDKNATTYRVTGLNPSTNYIVEMGYKEIYSDATTKEETEDTMTVRTTNPTESLEITKVSLNKIYYTLKLDSDFVYDDGVVLSVYVDGTKDSEIKLSESALSKAASSGYSGELSIPDDYKKTGGTIKIQLEDTKYNSKTIDTNLMAKIVNY